MLIEKNREGVKIKGAKGYEIGNIIKKNLKNNVKSGKELYESVIKELGINVPIHLRKSYDRNLIMLLEKEKIKIIGYDPSKDKRKVKQAFNSDPLIFDSSERLTRPEIQKLLNVMESDDEAYQRIRERFKDRMKNLNTFYTNRWSFLNEWTFVVQPDDFEFIFSDFGFYDDINDMISNLSVKEKEAYIEYYYGDSDKADIDLYDEVYSKIHNIIDDVFGKISQREEEENEMELEKEEGKLEESFDINSFLDGEFLGEEYSKEYHNKYDLEKLIEEMSTILILLDKYKDTKNVKVWLYPIYPFQFYDVWNDFVHDHNLELYKDVYIETLLDSTYTLKVDSYGYWEIKWALKEGGYENYAENLKTPNKAFEHTIDIISTYSDKERKILMGILAKGLSDEPDSLQVFAEFYLKINAVNYPKRLNKVLGIVSDDGKQIK
ncbi:hypothetical protein [Methanobacterium sp. SMA-27]|uniref:hypothetical protein n=1 Tax=Methanobacterium sp. SMA-27 TaxID=1495336 RepID=UPI00064EA014|nr:hypothetical protein [Methanobacterium sp. SMA-27]